MDTLVKKACLQFLVLSLFVVMGGLMFRAVEKTDGNPKEEKEEMLKSLETKMSSKYNMSAQDFLDFAKTAYDAQTPTREWTVEQSIGFAVSVVTTIGFGVFIPTTPLGRSLCIFYALLGIPLTLLTLNSLGSLITRGTRRLICVFEKRVLQQHAEPRELDVKVSVLTCLLTILILVTGSGIAVMLSDWSFSVALYFWFVTFTTIGFGDYVLSESVKKKPDAATDVNLLFGILTFLMILIGLAVVASLINSLVGLADKRRCELRLCPCSPRIDNSNEQGRENQPTATHGTTEIHELP